MTGWIFSFRVACRWLLVLNSQCTSLVWAVIQIAHAHTQELLERLAMSLRIRYLHALVADKSCAWHYSHHLLKACVRHMSSHHRWLRSYGLALPSAALWLHLERTASPREHEAMHIPGAFLCVWLPLSKQSDFLGSDLLQRVSSKDSWDLIKGEHEDNIFWFWVRLPAA